MSDFDREAEREKLRKQFERDKKKREASEQMSELLLQGATMTNRHCKECHAPIFRYDGREFCPTCRREVAENGDFVGGASVEKPTEDGAEAESSADAGGPTEAESQPETGTSTEGDGRIADEPVAEGTESAANAEADSESESESEADQPSVAEPEREITPAEKRTEPEEAAQPAEHTQPREPPQSRKRSRSETNPDGRSARSGGRQPTAPESPVHRKAGDLAEAEASLVRTLTDLTRRAEDARDVGRKRELLAAAREAAETLQALRRT